MENDACGGFKAKDIRLLSFWTDESEMTLRNESFQTFCEFELFSFGGERGTCEEGCLSGFVDVEKRMIVSDRFFLRRLREDVYELVDEDGVDFWTLNVLISFSFERE